MIQSLMAFLGIVLLSITALNMKQADLHSRTRALNAELESMAVAVASNTMEYIATKPFDARTQDGTVSPANPDASLLTPPASFGSVGTFDAASDLDDFDGLAADTVYFDLAADRRVGFLVSAEVHYLTATGQVSPTPTWTKEVTLTVDGPLGIDDIRWLPAPATLSRRFSPQW